MATWWTALCSSSTSDAGQVRGVAGGGEVIEGTRVADGVTERVLIIEWTRPPHVVVIVDDIRQEERIVTVCSPTESVGALTLR